MNEKKIMFNYALRAVGVSFSVLFLYNIYHYVSSQTGEQITMENVTKLFNEFIERNKHIPINKMFKYITPGHENDFSIEEFSQKQGLMIDTPGCQIPFLMVNYTTPKQLKKGSCGERAVFFSKSSPIEITAYIDKNKMKQFLKQSTKYSCCYRFFQRSTKPGFEHVKLQFTECRDLKGSQKILLESDFINVKCTETFNNISHVIYEDDYAYCRLVNNTTSNPEFKKFNVLVVGMDSMSLPRFIQTMTRSSVYMKYSLWPGFRGYHKVGDNTFPNLMAALTGQNLSTVVKDCGGRMDQCKDRLIWNIFKKAGYVTAYGEDYLELPDMFSKAYAFHDSPTDHYMRTFFLKGEREIDNRSLVCMGKTTSGQQLLDYAVDFVKTYRDKLFFGFFWLNSFSHNINNRPQDADKIFEDFFNRLKYTGVLHNTFVIFLSDHGIRFGEKRLKVESYYDNRMPFLFLWLPPTFTQNYSEKIRPILINQFRLITPYDVFDTLMEINSLSGNNGTSNSSLTSMHQSIFSTVSENRRCQDVGIHDKWCSCHKLYPLDDEDTEGVKSVQLVSSYIKETIKNIRTKPCWSCTNLTFNNISRIHFYYDEKRINQYYLVAFSMSPGNIFYEAKVLRKDEKMEIVGSVNIISLYRGFGKCTVKREDRIFCVCKKNDNCRITKTF